MKLCHLLPKVKSTLKIPADKHLLQQLEMCVRKLLCQEKDKDVLAMVKRVSAALNTGVSCIKMSQSYLRYFSLVFKHSFLPNI